jgi:ankyrin repeat protein
MMKYFRYFIYLFVTITTTPSAAGSYDDFFEAVTKDDVRVVEALMARGFDPNTRNPKGQPALTMALQIGSRNVTRALVAQPKTDVDATNDAGETPLMMAALKGERAVAQQLLDRGARVHRPGWSPILYAAAGPDPQIVALLLDRAAPVDAESPNRTTPLMMAARYGSEPSVRLLLARGADPKRRNDRQLGPADFAREGGRALLAEELGRLAR